MKNLTISLLFAFFCLQTFQAQKCGSIRNLGLIKANNPALYNDIMAIENHTTAYIQAQSLKSLTAQTIIQSQ
jgi:hypothetical protein